MQTILIADDHRANRDALAYLLEAAGYRVLMAANGAEALQTALEQRPDLVISDVLMPKMDGYGLARRLRADPATAATRLMFYTAYFDRREAKELAQAHGVERVLAKPSENDAILGAVREVLEARAEPLAAVAPDLDRDRLRMMVDQLLEKTGALELQQRRIERLNRTLEVLSAVNALIVRAGDRQALLEEACRIAVEKGGFGSAEISLQGGGADITVSRGDTQGEFPAETVLPLKVSEQASGSLRLRAGSPDFFDDEAMHLLNELAADVSFALHHLEQKARMDYLACHDSLTDLPNRSLFADRMAQTLNAARRSRRCSSTSSAFAWSTRPSAASPATACCARWRAACARRRASRTRWRGSAPTTSPSRWPASTIRATPRTGSSSGSSRPSPSRWWSTASTCW